MPTWFVAGVGRSGYCKQFETIFLREGKHTGDGGLTL